MEHRVFAFITALFLGVERHALLMRVGEACRLCMPITKRKFIMKAKEIFDEPEETTTPTLAVPLSLLESILRGSRSAVFALRYLQDSKFRKNIESIDYGEAKND